MINIVFYVISWFLYMVGMSVEDEKIGRMFISSAGIILSIFLFLKSFRELL